MARSPIPIYADERGAGLATAIAANRSLAYISPLLVPSESLKQILLPQEAVAAYTKFLATAGETTFDLYPLYTILATTGWNKNDDIFDRQETWIARATPEDKPFNQGHVPSKIIGHITSSAVVDEKLAIIADDTDFDKLPGKFHVVTSAVIYRHINSRDKDLQAEAAALIEGIENGDWFVSMEALFSNFDYGLTTAAGEQQVIARNEKTAFLTKHLRIYEGCGEYNGCKLGRVLRNITFSGKGLVKNPANPESVILNDAKQFVGVLASLKEAEPETTNAGVNNMSVETEKIAELETKLAAANRKLEEVGTQQVQASLAAKDAEVAKAQTAVAEHNKKIETLTSDFNAAVAAKNQSEEAHKTTTTKLTETTAKLTEITTQLETIKAEAQKTNRISTLIDKGVDKAEAEKIVTKFAGSTDEVFAEIVTMQADLVIAKKKPAAEDTQPDADKNKSKPGNCAKADDTADAAGAAAAAAADLNGAKADPDPALSVADTDKNGEVISALASFFDQTLTSGRETAKK